MITAIYNYPFPTLDIDEHYILREQQIEDTDAFLEYYGDQEVARYILAKTPSTLKDARDELEYCKKLFTYRQGIYWSIARKDNNRMIGAIGLYINNHHHRAEICYDLHKNYWRQNIISNAMTVAIYYMFRFAGLHRIEAITIKENTASIKTLEKLGFIHEGSLLNYRYYENKPHNVEMYAITKKIFNELQKLQKDDSPDTHL